ncbi:RNA polymerase ECF-type sigma factor [Pedobacter cryoconitis]|uniref:RNA polymerase ECF-type sigma factor n=1 Tax=Pedobacter cryoconitis TaxID=188932 RepID=A0A127VDQ3_9SPHI|nr:RNA polymerase sigma-70 factor [Pedobacter cryoconitis]AMP99506.1 RNA polymerase ECF-type sigma factor [Pedobacter cryoconitis]
MKKARQEIVDWMQELYEGNEKALAYFFKLHSKSLAYFTTRMLEDKAEADDIVSKCFLKVWQKHKDFKTEQNIKAFLYISCRNACLDYLASLKVRTAAQENYIKYLLGGEETILYDVVQTEVLDMVNKEIEELPDKMKIVFKMLYIEGKSTAEIAEELGLSIQTVRNQKTKAVALIKNSLLKKGVSNALQLAFLFFITK